MASRGWLRRVTLTRVLFACAGALIAWGYQYPTGRYLTPERGLGYAFGVIGGSMMLLLLVYPARKRLRSLAVIGSAKRWFQLHMLFGVLGPILILYHSNFSLGAANSNVALWSMLVVASSGLAGRYFYARIHHGLHGRRATHAELAAAAERLRDQTTTVAFLPELAAELKCAEEGLLDPRAPWLLAPVLLAWRLFRAERRLRRYVDAGLRRAALDSPVVRAHAARLRAAAFDYVSRRLRAARRVGELESFERLFSWWHVLHLPLFFMLVIAGVTHVIAVHVY